MTPVSVSSINNALQRHTAPTPPAGSNAQSLSDAKALKQTYSQFVGETFFGSMLKSMRQSVGEPAYFHGGMAEEQFQARLDQQMAADLAAGQGATFADSLFKTDHPEAAALLAAADNETAAASSASGLAALDALRPR